jgi:tetratricopeptide (TPR) repeat protein
MKRFWPLVILGSLVIVTITVVIVAVAMQSFSGESETDVAHAHEGIALMQQHLYHAAIQEFEAATRQTPQLADPWVGLAAVYIRLGNGQKAVEDAAKAVHLAADSADVQLILGRAHWLARNFSDAEQAALKVEELDPSNAHAAELLGHIYFDRNDDTRFREVLDRSENPNRGMQDLAVQFAIRRGEFRRAYELRKSFDRRDLEADVFRSQLALKRNRSRLEIYPDLIRKLVRLERVDEALASAREYKGLAFLDVELGKAHWLAGNREEAVRAFSRAASSSPHKLSAEVALAALTRDPQHWIEAFRAEWIEKDYFVLAQLEDLLKTASPMEKALIYRYAGIYDIELLNSAAREAQLVLKSQPENFEALMTLGTAYSRLGRIEDASRYVEQSAQKYSERAEVWARLGQFALQKGDLEAAAVSMDKALQREPSNASHLYNYAWVLDQLERDNEASRFYERAIESSAYSYEAMNNLALIESARGHQDRALALLKRAVESNPENEMAYMNRGNYYAALKSWRNSLLDYDRVRELNPANALALVESARVHMELDRVDIAIDEINTALDIDPTVPDGYVLLSSAYKKQGREKESAAALDESKRLKEPR